MANVYICYTVMHVYVALLKVYSSTPSAKNFLVLTDHISEVDDLASRLEDMKAFDEIFLINDIHLTNLFRGQSSKIGTYLFFKRRILTFFDIRTSFINVLLTKYTNNQVTVNVFLDSTFTSFYFMFKFGAITLVEDGLGLYSPERRRLGSFVKHLLGVPKTQGKDGRVRTVEATMPKKLQKEVFKKSKLLDITDMRNKLDANDRIKIARLFMGSDPSIFVGDKILILTQPFSEDGLLSEEKKICLYAEIINKYKGTYKVYIKPHPRELTDYRMVFPFEIVQLERRFPIEVLDLVMVDKFNRCVAIDSTGLKNLECVTDSINLGIDYDSELSDVYRRRFKRVF